MKKKLWCWLILLIPLVALAPVINQFAYMRDYSTFSDLTATFYSNALQIHHAVFQYHTLPLWSDTILSGFPFAADTQSGLWYLPTWLPNLIPSAASFNLILIFHLILAGSGMTLFLRREGLSDFASLAGGVVFELMPKLWAHFGAGHYTLLIAVCWTPWLLFAQKEYILSGFAWKRILFPGIVFGVIILSNPIWAPFAALLWVAYALVAGVMNRKTLPSKANSRWLLKTVGGGLLQGVVALLISAPVWLPLMEFTQLSSRILMTTSDNMLASLPSLYLVNLFIPNIGGMHEWVVYLGVFTLFLIVLALWENKKGSLTWFWAILIAICLLISLGTNLPLIPYLFRLPFFNLLRVPTRFYFLACMAGSILFAHGFETFISAGKKPATGFKRLWIGISFFIILLSIGMLFVTQKWGLQYLWSIVAFTLTLIILLLWDKSRIAPATLGMVVAGLICVDLLGVNFLGLKFRPEQQVYAEGADIAAFLKSQAGVFRVYSPSYSLPEQTAARFGIQQADGINPLMLMSYVDFMESATGIPIRHYSVTMPDFPSNLTATDNAAYTPDAHLLGLLNVRFVLSEFDLSSSDLSLVKNMGSTRIYENKQWLPRAWVQRETTPLGDGILSVPDIATTPNDFKIDATGPGQLVLSEVYYPGWKMYIDGIEQPIKIIDGIFMGADLTGGNLSLDFIFQPSLILIALILAAIAWTGIVVFMVFAGKNG